MATSQRIKAGSRARGGCLAIVLGTFFGGFGSVFAAAGISMLVHSEGLLSLLFVGLGGLFALGGLSAVGYGMRAVWLGRVLGRMVLELPSGQLELGGTLVVRFRRAGGARRAARSPAVTAELHCHESATYRQGTDDHTVRQELSRSPLAVFPDPVPGTVAGRVEVGVPLSQPPTMSLPHNGIVWELTLTVRVAGVPDDVSVFALDVAPVVRARR